MTLIQRNATAQPIHAGFINFVVNIVIEPLRVFWNVAEYRANLYTRLTMAKRRKERRSRYEIKETQPAIIIKRLDQRKVNSQYQLYLRLPKLMII